MATRHERAAELSASSIHSCGQVEIVPDPVGPRPTRVKRRPDPQAHSRTPNDESSPNARRLGMPVMRGHQGRSGLSVVGRLPCRRVVAAAVGCVIMLLSGCSGSNGTEPDTKGATTVAPSVVEPSLVPSTSASTVSMPERLLTPAGAEHVIAELIRTTGVTDIYHFELSETKASANVTLPAEPRRLKFFYYYVGLGVVMDNGTDDMKPAPTVDIRTIAWARLPDLLAQAEREFGVQDPVRRFASVVPADPEGKILKVCLLDRSDAQYKCLKATADGRLPEPA